MVALAWDWYWSAAGEARAGDGPASVSQSRYLVRRGGSYYDAAGVGRSASRFNLTPEYRDIDLGERRSMRVPVSRDRLP